MRPERLDDRHVHINEIRADQCITPKIAVSARCRQLERCRIIPAFNRADDRVVRRPGAQVRPLRRVRVPVVGAVETELRAERRAGVRGHDHACLPASSQNPRGACQAVAGKTVGCIHGERVPKVERRQAAVGVRIPRNDGNVARILRVRRSPGRGRRDCARIRVTRLPHQPVRLTPCGLQLQRVVFRIGIGHDLTDVAKCLIYAWPCS